MTSIRVAVAAFAILAAGPASALTVGSNGAHGQASSLTNPITTTQDCPVGAISVLYAATPGVAHLSSVADSAGNTYSVPQDVAVGTGVETAFVYTVVTIDLPSAGTITATFGASTNSQVIAHCIKNAATVNVLDKHGNTATASAVTTSPSVATGTLSQSAEGVILIVGISGGSSAQSCATGTIDVVSGTTGLILCRQVVASNASLADTASWTTSRNAVANIISFNGANPGPLPGSALLLGAGP